MDLKHLQNSLSQWKFSIRPGAHWDWIHQPRDEHFNYIWKSRCWFTKTLVFVNFKEFDSTKSPRKNVIWFIMIMFSSENTDSFFPRQRSRKKPQGTCSNKLNMHKKMCPMIKPASKSVHLNLNVNLAANLNTIKISTDFESRDMRSCIWITNSKHQQEWFVLL